VRGGEPVPTVELAGRARDAGARFVIARRSTAVPPGLELVATRGNLTLYVLAEPS
jgi:hypothetical protein